MRKPPYNSHYQAGNGIVVDCGHGPSDYSSALIFSETGTWSSSKTPNFRNIKPRDRPHNPFSASYTSEMRRASIQGNGICTWSGYLDDFYSGTRLPLPTLPALGTKAQAKSKLLSNLNSSNMNLGQAFAERKQTTDMLSKSVNRLAAAAMAIRRGNLKHASELFGNKQSRKSLLKEIPPSPKNLANHWLEFSYGWRPLLSDIHGATQTIWRSYNEERTTIVRVSSSARWSVANHVLFYDSAYGQREALQGALSEKCTYVLEYIEDSSYLAKAAQLGLTNPLLLAWELIPYSFVVDWILPVGTYLDHLDATTGLSFRKGCVTVKREFHGKSYWGSYKAPGNGSYWSSRTGRIFTNESKVREVLYDFPSPELKVSPHIGVSQVLSGLALLTQAFKR